MLVTREEWQDALYYTCPNKTLVPRLNTNVILILKWEATWMAGLELCSPPSFVKAGLQIKL